MSIDFECHCREAGGVSKKSRVDCCDGSATESFILDPDVARFVPPRIFSPLLPIDLGGCNDPSYCRTPLPTRREKGQCTMTRFTRLVATALPALVLPLVQSGAIARASGGINSVQTVALHRQGCAASTVGSVVGSARFSLDDQGGGNVNPNGIEVRASVTAGQPRTDYGVYVVDGTCQVLAAGGTLITDDSGRGDLGFHVLGSVVPPGTTVRVQLVSPADVLTSDAISAA